MGKCKKRTFQRTNSSSKLNFMTREDAVSSISKTFISKNNNDYKSAYDTISLFGISAEELSEAGVPYENLKALSNILT